MRTKLAIAALALSSALLGQVSFPSSSTNWHKPVPHREGLVLFGGLGSSDLADTWVWDGTTWEQRFPKHSPPARDSAAMAYDALRHEVVLFGGVNSSQLLGDTWIWDGRDWHEESPATAPPARRLHAMAYDAAQGNVVLFGGTGAEPAYNDTWVWNGSAWKEKTPAQSPSPRIVLGTMTYDPANREVVLFSGDEFLSHFANSDTWQWNGSEWREQTPAQHPDGTFGGFSLAYDPVQHKVVAFGRSEQPLPGGPEIEPVTWLWDGQSWTQEFPQHNPANTGSSNMALDGSAERAFLIDSSFNLWHWTGYDWNQLSPAVAPPARGLFALSTGVAEWRCW